MDFIDAPHDDWGFPLKTGFVKVGILCVAGQPTNRMDCHLVEMFGDGKMDALHLPPQTTQYCQNTDFSDSIIF